MLSVIVAWASGNKGPQDTTGLKYDEDDVSNCSNSCQTREVTYYGCQNANQEECTPYRKHGGWKSGPASGWKDSATIVMLMTMTKAMKVAMEEMMAMEVVERMAAGVVAATMIATTVVIR